MSKQFARSRKPAFLSRQTSLSFGTGWRLRRETEHYKLPNTEAEEGVDDLVNREPAALSPEEAALEARKKFGDALPEDYLSDEEYRVYERLYGTPLRYGEESLEEEKDGGVLVEDGDGTGVLKTSEDGALEEVEFEEREDAALENDVGEGEDDGLQFTKSGDDARLAADIDVAFSSDSDASPEQVEGVEAEEDTTLRAHPLTIVNRFSTFPSTLPLPKQSLVEPIKDQLSPKSNTHLKEAAHRVFGGVGLPYSVSTPAIGKTMQQKPVALDASQNHMSEMEGDVFLAALLPGMYASIMSVLVETRKRLGTAWVEVLVKKAERNELRVLDAGAGGAGILAVREMLKAEWERMHDESSSLDSVMALAEADGKLGGASASPPLGLATVLTGSDVLRKRASKLLENTTFVPRLPDYLHAEEAKKVGKFDIVIAPHTLWPLKEDYLRKSHLQNLWGMLSQDGGVMLVLEKGVARGFEMIADAREMLLDSSIASSHPTREQPLNPLKEGASATNDMPEKDKGTIIAPCTNHNSCPMYKPQGRVKGRRDFCHFSQRYVRPPFLQTILGAKDKNWEDVKFSYLAIMRGRDLREENGIEQGTVATDRAFDGYQEREFDGQKMMEMSIKEAQVRVPSLSLPRMVLPAIKRQGHVIIDVCTPAGTLERWTVPRSFDREAFRDARKSSWGDLWALGAKTRVPRIPKIKKRTSNADMDVKGVSKKGGKGMNWDADEYGSIVADSQGVGGAGEGGNRRSGRKVKGVRDKRDKKGSGNGRKKRSFTE